MTYIVIGRRVLLYNLSMPHINKLQLWKGKKSGKWFLNRRSSLLLFYQLREGSSVEKVPQNNKSHVRLLIGVFRCWGLKIVFS
jgi:hypothetical protein